MSQSRFVRDRNANLAAISFDDFMAAKLQQAFREFAVTSLPTQIPQHSAPKVPIWIPSKSVCEKSYNGCSGQLNKFLCSLLPNATDFTEQIAAKISEAKSQQIKEIFVYLSANFISDKAFKEELQKQLIENRNKITKKIYEVLKKHRGCLLTKFGRFIPCRYNFVMKKYIPIVEKRGDYFFLRNTEWGIPNSSKDHGFVIVANVDHVQRKRMIYKIELRTGEMSLLHKCNMRKN